MKIIILLLLSAVTYGQTLTITPAGSIVGDVLKLEVYAKQSEVTELKSQLAATIAQSTAIAPTVTMVKGSTLLISSHKRYVTVKDTGSITLPPLPDGFTCWITNGSIGNIDFKLLGVTRYNSAIVTRLVLNARPVQVTYYPNNIVNIR